MVAATEEQKTGLSPQGLMASPTASQRQRPSQTLDPQTIETLRQAAAEAEQRSAFSSFNTNFDDT
jgi:hypothetical protein